MRRAAMRALLSCIVSTAACTSKPEIPPPPSEAVASCDFNVPAGGGRDTSTLWYDANDRVIRIDGYEGEDRAAYSYAYDGEGRVIEEKGPSDVYRYAYSADVITETGTYGTWLMQLVDGHVVRYAGPQEKPLGEQTIREYEFDAQGRITKEDLFEPQARISDVYTYDSQGRLASVSRNSQTPTTLSYTETDTQLIVDLTGPLFTRRWSYDFDSLRRLVGVRLEDRVAGTDIAAAFTYSDEGITQEVDYGAMTYVLHGTGRCDPPTVELNPKPLPPVWTYADYVYWRDITNRTW